MFTLEPVNLEFLVDTLALELLVERKVKWIYCNEGNNKIVAIFKLTEPVEELDRKYYAVIENIENTAFRLRK